MPARAIRSSRSRGLVVVLALASCVLAALAVPGLAGAETYTVNSTADLPDKEIGMGGCETATAGQCTLRAAIQEANSSVGTLSQIGFDGSLFDGELADTINLGAAFPKITDQIIVSDGPSCPKGAGVTGPCVGVHGPAGEFGLWVENTDNSAIAGLALTGALTGLNVTGSSNAITVTRNWFGVKLDGTAGPNNLGMFVDPGSDGAFIGGTDPMERNVFANNNVVGLDLEGASNATIRGNYFGVAPDGVTQAANPKNIEITDSTATPGFEAVDNVIGAQLSGGTAATQPCDGGCNVISGATSFGIDLKGDGAGQNEAPASGAQIRGNHIGLNAAGTGAIANATVGILVGEADDVVIGGPSGEYTNHVNGGLAGVRAGTAADDLVVEGNVIGLNHNGTVTLAPPTQEGIAVNAQGISDDGQATITHNRISMGAGVAISHLKGGANGATIADNVIGRSVTGQSLLGPGFGIRVAESQGAGNLIEGNVVENVIFSAISIESNNNLVVGNEIDSAGDSAIRIEGADADGNTIGGDSAAEENTISNSGEDAIETGPAATDNQFRRNIGSGNAGLFIDLGGDGPGNAGVNGGIQPPVITTATPSAVSGTAAANATVRVFEKATAAPGEIMGFLGEAEADGAGNWALDYDSPIPEGIPIGATQTGFEGTSELATSTTAVPQPPGGNGGGGGGGSAASPADNAPPQTKITKGPPGKSSKRTAKFRFSASEAGSTFRCRLDRKPFKPCKSPRKYQGLKPGKHVFRVRATDSAGNVDASPAKKVFRVLD